MRPMDQYLSSQGSGHLRQAWVCGDRPFSAVIVAEAVEVVGPALEAEGAA